MMFVKLPGVKKFWAVWLRTRTMIASAKMTGQLPRLPERMLSTICVGRAPSSVVSGSGAAAWVVTPSPRARVSRRHLGSRAGSRNPRDLRRRTGGNRVHDLLLRRLRALVHAHVAAEAENGYPRRGLEDVVQVVRDQDDAETLFRQPVDERQHLLGLRDAERGGRLVEDHEPRVPHHRACDRD